MKRTAAFLALLFIAYPALADRCWMTGGCVDQIGYIHIPDASGNLGGYFKDGDLPQTNEIVKVSKNAHVFWADSLLDERLPADLANAVKNGTQLAWGMEIRGGAKVRVLGFATFPHLGKDLSRELFMLVRILSDE